MSSIDNNSLILSKPIVNGTFQYDPYGSNQIGGKTNRKRNKKNIKNKTKKGGKKSALKKKKLSSIKNRRNKNA